MTRRTAERLELALAEALVVAHAGCVGFRLCGSCNSCQRWAWQEVTGEDCPLEDFAECTAVTHDDPEWRALPRVRA